MSYILNEIEDICNNVNNNSATDIFTALNTIKLLVEANNQNTDTKIIINNSDDFVNFMKNVRKTKLSNRINVAYDTLVNASSKRRTPNLTTLFKILNGLGLRLVFEGELNETLYKI